MIAVDSPTVNKISLKLMLTLAASKGLQVQCNDIQRAFLQTVGIDRDVYVQAPPEAQLPNGKVWKLKRAVYGLVDASRAFFLRHAKGLNELGFKAVKYDNATFVKTNAKGDTEMITSVHVDDTVNVASEEVLKKHHNQMKEKFKYGSSDDIPCRYLGMNMARNENGDIILDQDHYVANLEIPDISETQGVKRDEVINEKLQSVFRSIASKLNMLSLSSRPDFAIQAKMLTTKYGSATKRDLLTAIKLLKMAKEEPTTLVIPNLGNVSDWILVGISDASHKKDGKQFAVAGQVIILVNRCTHAASVLHWSSQKINRRVSSSLAAETIAMEKLAENLFFVKQLMLEIIGPSVKDVPGPAITDNQDLFSCIHNIKSCDNKRLLEDIIQIRQAIHDDKVISEVRYSPGRQNLADGLTKLSRVSSQDLMTVLRTGSYDVPGGTCVRDSTQLSVKTWQQLVTAEEAAKTLSPPQLQPSTPGTDISPNVCISTQTTT